MNGAHKKPSWGIVRYAAGSGLSPEDDCSAFDGWYVNRADAEAVYRYWLDEHPNWIVALVSAHPDDIRWEYWIYRTHNGLGAV